MTKEEILEKQVLLLIENNPDENYVPIGEIKEQSEWGSILEAMQLYADQQTAEKDKRIKELTEFLSRLVFLHECEQEGLSSGQPTPEMWFEAVNKASEVLTKINK